MREIGQSISTKPEPLPTQRNLVCDLDLKLKIYGSEDGQEESVLSLQHRDQDGYQEVSTTRHNSIGSVELRTQILKCVFEKLAEWNGITYSRSRT